MRVALLLACTLVGFVGGCAHPTAKTTVMHYDDFGPHAAVYEWLGDDWWQWQDEGDPDPNKPYNIQVVVYRDCSLDEVRRKYPTIPEQLKDYRYISYEEALQHLDALIAENALPTLTEQLVATRRELQRRFGVHD